MLSLVSVLLLAQLLPSEQLIRPRVYRSDGADRVMRLGADDYAFLEFAPASGAGMPAACSSTAPTGAKGEALTLSRGSGAVCTKTATGGLVTSGIADGDLVEVSSNVARVEYDSAGVKGLRVEGAGQNVLTRFIDYTNLAWSDVGTPTPTTGQASPFSGTYATSAVLYDDNDGAAFEGRSIPIAVSAGSAYWAHCYVKGGTATSARIVLDGTAATITGLSATSWSIVEVGDASASAASITFEVDVGSTAAATGTVVWGGCDVKLGTYRTSIVPTAAAAVTRNVETASFQGRDLSGLVASASTAATLDRPRVFDSVALNLTGTVNTIGVMAPYLQTNTSFGVYSGSIIATQAVPALNANTTRLATSWSGTTFSSWYAGNQVSAAGTAFAGTQTVVQLCDYNTSHSCDGIISRVCVDPSPSRCR